MSRKTSNRKILNKIMKKVVSFTENRYRKITDSYSRSEIYKQCLPYLNSQGLIQCKHTNSQLHWQSVAKAKIPDSSLAAITKPVQYVQNFSGFTGVITIRNGWSRVAPQNITVRLSITFPPTDIVNTDATTDVIFDILSNNYTAYWIKGIRLAVVMGSSKPEYDGLYIQILTQTTAGSQYHENVLVEINHNYNHPTYREWTRFEVLSAHNFDEYFVSSDIRDEIDLLIRNETSHVTTFATTAIEGKRYGMNQKLDKTGGELTGNVKILHDGNGTSTGPCITTELSNPVKSNVSLHSALDGKHGLYSSTPVGWLIEEDLDGRAYTRATAPNVRTYEIVSNADLNSFIPPNGFCPTCGFWYCPSNAVVATLKNCPTTNAFCLKAERHAGFYQELTEYTTSNPRKFFRNFYNGSWDDGMRYIIKRPYPHWKVLII